MLDLSHLTPAAEVDDEVTAFSNDAVIESMKIKTDMANAELFANFRKRAEDAAQAAM